MFGLKGEFGVNFLIKIKDRGEWFVLLPYSWMIQVQSLMVIMESFNSLPCFCVCFGGVGWGGGVIDSYSSCHTDHEKDQVLEEQRKSRQCSWDLISSLFLITNFNLCCLEATGGLTTTTVCSRKLGTLKRKSALE